MFILSYLRKVFQTNIFLTILLLLSPFIFICIPRDMLFDKNIYDSRTLTHKYYQHILFYMPCVMMMLYRYHHHFSFLTRYVSFFSKKKIIKNKKNGILKKHCLINNYRFIYFFLVLVDVSSILFISCMKIGTWRLLHMLSKTLYQSTILTFSSIT